MDLYHKAGIKVLVSAFGATDFPTSVGRQNAVTVGQNLAKFVKDNNLDGVDLDYEDNTAMNAGQGEKWVCDCTNTLRQLLPAPYIITHAPQGPYFMGPPSYPSGGYVAVDKTCGSAVDWYNVQFYNQESTAYATYTSIFQTADGWATGTSVGEIVKKGVPAKKLVVGKGVTQADVFNSGYLPVATFAQILRQGVAAGYTAGFMGWQFSSDPTGAWSNALVAVFPKAAAVVGDGTAQGSASGGLSEVSIGLIVGGVVLAVVVVVVGVVIIVKRRKTSEVV